MDIASINLPSVRINYLGRWHQQDLSSATNFSFFSHHRTPHRIKIEKKENKDKRMGCYAVIALSALSILSTLSQSFSFIYNKPFYLAKGGTLNSIESKLFSVHDDIEYYRPDSEELDFGELRRRLKQQGKVPPEDVFIILFDKDTENEGAYTIEYPSGSGKNFLLAFENEFDADLFAQTLKVKELSDFRVSPEPQTVDYMALENAADVSYCMHLLLKLNDSQNI